MHKLLRRQLRKSFGSLDSVPGELRPFVDVVDAAYEQADHDRRLLERSLDLASDELLAANRELREYAQGLEQRVEQHTAQLRTANESLQLEIAERRLAEAEIRKSEERYRTLFEGSKDAIYISTPSDRLIDINPAGVELFGYASKEELLEIDLSKQVYRHPEDRERFLQEVGEKGFVRDAELELIRKDGKIITVLATTSAVGDEDGEVTAFRGILRDVTEQRRLERQLRQAQKMEAVGRLAGGVAHDFNNLLTAILGYSERLAAMGSTNETERSCAEAIAAAAKRGAELTSQLLAFGRRQVLRPMVLDLNIVITDMRRLLRRVIPEDVELVTQLAPHLGSVHADRAQLEQVILNLAINAGDAMPGGGRLTLRTAQTEVQPGLRSCCGGIEAGSYAVLAVEDTGVGIEESIRDQVFEPFFTTKRDSRGTGLGLATVYSAVHESNGHVTMTSEVGLGTCFRVLMPSVTEPPPPAEPEPRSTVPVMGSELLLVVEDDPAVQLLLREFLQEQGYTVLSANDGIEGLELGRRERRRIDLVLTDVVMPRMNGIELARCLRQEQPSIKVLLISGHTEDHRKMQEESLRGPGCSFLQKPFRTTTLAQRIRELLDE